MPIFRVKSVKIYTGQKKIYTGAGRGARDKYEVCITVKFSHLSLIVIFGSLSLLFKFVITCHCWKLSPQLLCSPLVFQGPPCPAWASNQFWVLEKNLFCGKKVYLHFPSTSAPWSPWWSWRRTSSRGGTILRTFTITTVHSFAIHYIFAQILCF